MEDTKLQAQIIEDDGYTITVSVVDPITKDQGVSKYILYTLKGEDKEGPFEVFRRYSDFDHLRNAFSIRWPGVYIPAMPPKKATGNLDSHFIEERRKFLEVFMKQLSVLKYLWYSEEMKAFLRSTNPDVEKVLAQLPKVLVEDQVKRYEDIFKNVIKQETTMTELDERITQFTLFLKKIKESLERYRGMIKNLIQVRTSHNDEFLKFLTFLLPEYEKNCLSEYVGNITDGKFLFADVNDQKLSDIITRIKTFMNKEEFSTLNELMKLEVWEVDAFLETIIFIQTFVKQLHAADTKLREHEKDLAKAQEGKTSKLTKMFSGKNDEQRATSAQAKIDVVNKEIEGLNAFIQIMKKVIGNYEIAKFKGEKVNKYYEVLKGLASFELEFAQHRSELWQYIIENENIAQQ